MSKKGFKVWMLNHYATDMYYEGAGRHQGFAKYLRRKGHSVKIFCANTVHNSSLKVDTCGKNSVEKEGKDGIPYVFVRTNCYTGNSVKRIINILMFYVNVFKAMREDVINNGNPDVILASSVHPLTLVAGIKFAKKIGKPCICEIRDLWPLSIVEYSRLTENNIFIKLLYRLEKWIYIKADAIIFSFPRGQEYIIDRKWDNSVDLKKVFYVNTGVDIELYNHNTKEICIEDEELDNPHILKIVYAGSIRKVNNVGAIIDAASEIEKQYNSVKFLIFGDGEERQELEKRCDKNGINNVVFKGSVPKEEIPSVLKKADILLINVMKNNLWKYGVSWNKLFEYMASGKPIIANSPTEIINDNNIGTAQFFNSVEEYSNAITKYIEFKEEDYAEVYSNAMETMKKYDCKVLSDKLEKIIEALLIGDKSNEGINIKENS